MDAQVGTDDKDDNNVVEDDTVSGRYDFIRFLFDTTGGLSLGSIFVSIFLTPLFERLSSL